MSLCLLGIVAAFMPTHQGSEAGQQIPLRKEKDTLYPFIVIVLTSHVGLPSTTSDTGKSK